MSKLIFLVLVLTFFNTLCSEAQIGKDIVQFEVFGHSSTWFSASYERLFPISKNDKLMLATRIGVGRTPGFEVDDETNDDGYFIGTFSLPVTLYFLYGKTHYLQIGVGYTGLFSEDYIDKSKEPDIYYKKYETDIGVSIGYRLMLESGLVVQTYPIVLFRDNPGKKVGYSFGVSLGYSFL